MSHWNSPVSAIAAGVVSLAGYLAGALTGRAALAATGVGASILRGGGLPGGVVLSTFFISGSLLPRFFRTRKFRSDRARNERQVLANGGVAAAGALLAPLLGSDRAFVVVSGSLAAAAADTWATEIGSTSTRVPRLILAGTPVKPGYSGGVTLRGNLGGIGGSLAISVLAGMLAKDIRLSVSVLSAGIVGTTVDSLVGELAQARYRDPRSGTVLESPPEHRDQDLIFGRAWIDNDTVNLACTLAGGATALVIWALSRR